MKSEFSCILVRGIIAIALVFPSCSEEEIKVESIALDRTELTVSLGDSERLIVVFTPLSATDKRVSWRSDKSSVVTVSDAGLLTAQSLGEASITAISLSDTLVKGACRVSVVPVSGTVYNISGNITRDEKWYNEARYMLSGFVYVRNPAVLTIEPGTVIMGVSGTRATLIIEKGAKIIAAGTVNQPVVFTSDKPKGQRNYGDWGGLVLCGNAPTNKHDNGTGIGIAEGGLGTEYGGNNPADNSGVLQYVRIEFPGIPLTSTANSEINGLTLYSVGSGTTIDHIQVSYSGDDSYEWFGGTVNCKYLVAFRGWDDDWDTDNGYTGKVQFFVSLRDPAIADQSQSNGFESDNDADGSTLTPVTAPLFVNGTVLGPLITPATTINMLYRSAFHLRRGSRLSIYNTVFAGWPNGMYIDGASGNSPEQALNNVLQIERCVMAGISNQFITRYLTDSEAWFLDNSRGNEIITANAGLLLTDPFNLTRPDFLPAAGSVLFSGASFINLRLQDEFFTSVAHRGAFGVTDWTTGWCNFDPQNTDY